MQSLNLPPSSSSWECTGGEGRRRQERERKKKGGERRKEKTNFIPIINKFMDFPQQFYSLYVFVHAYAIATGRHKVSPSISLPSFLRQGLSLHLEFIDCLD